MHHKRRKRRRGGIKGHCGMCALLTRRGGLRNQRRPTLQERRAALGEREQRAELARGHERG